MKLALSQPTQSGKINQPFGANPLYYSKFLDAQGNPMKGHMGIDYYAVHATPLYAEIDGIAFYVTDAHGGDGIYIHTPPLDWAGGTHEFNIINWHLCSKDDPIFKPVIPTDGSRVSVKRGDLLGYTDNTGAPFESLGDHLHFGLMPTDINWATLYPENGYGGCIDPAPYVTLPFAVPIVSEGIAVAEQAISVATQLPPQQESTWLTKIAQFLQSLLNYIQK